MSRAEQHVLVVDDEEVILEALDEVLTDVGFRVVIARNVAQALEVFETQPVGVAVVDKNLPGDRDGLDLLRELRRRFPQVQVIIHTAYASTGSAIQALQHGAFDYLEKPTENALLVEKVKRAWDSHAAAVAQAGLLQTYEALFAVIPGVIWFRTDEGRITAISHQGAQLLGYGPEELVGASYQKLLDLDSAEGAAHWAFKERRIGARATRRLPVTLRTRTGEKRVFEISSAAVDDPRGFRYRGTLGVGWDVSDQNELLTELQQGSKMDALGRLAGGVAHDFNNVLSVIGACTEFIRDAASIEAAAPDLCDISAAVERAAGLTRQLLLFSRKEVVVARPIRVADAVASVRGMLARLLREDVRVEVDVDPDLGLVEADLGQLEQVIVNLAINARDAMPEGGVLAISARNVSIEEEYATEVPNLWPGEFVLLAVSDTGQGMSRETREHLFEPFYTTKEAGKGTGLGMSIVYGIVRQAGGFVSVYSELGLGTTIKLYLPRLVGEGERAVGQVEDSRSVGTETVLLVEDDGPVRRVARRILERAGYRIIEASDGRAALGAWDATTTRIDLLVTDVIMPGMGGLELGRELRLPRPDLPIVYTSGHLGALVGHPEMTTECAVFLPKPFTAAQLRQSVRQALDGSRSRA